MDDFDVLSRVPFFVWIILAVVLLAQGIWVFLDASRRGERKWLWGFFALLSTPGNLLIYLLVTRVISRSKTCPSCGTRISIKARFCGSCGKEQQLPILPEY